MRYLICLLFLVCLVSCEFFETDRHLEHESTVRVVDSRVSSLDKHRDVQVYLGVMGEYFLEKYKTSDFFICTSSGEDDYMLEGVAVEYNEYHADVPADVMAAAFADERVTILRFVLPDGATTGPALVGAPEFLREFHLVVER